MTVRELLAELEDYGPDAQVVLSSGDHSYRKVGSVRLEPAEVLDHGCWIGEWYDEEQGPAQWVVVLD